MDAIGFPTTLILFSTLTDLLVYRKKKFPRWERVRHHFAKKLWYKFFNAISSISGYLGLPTRYSFQENLQIVRSRFQITFEWLKPEFVFSTAVSTSVILVARIYLIEKTLSCKKLIYYERYDPMVFWEAGKLASVLRLSGDNINTGYSTPLQNLLRNENILNINIWNSE